MRVVAWRAERRRRDESAADGAVEPVPVRVPGPACIAGEAFASTVLCQQLRRPAHREGYCRKEQHADDATMHGFECLASERGEVTEVRNPSFQR